MSLHSAPQSLRSQPGKPRRSLRTAVCALALGLTFVAAPLQPAQADTTDGVAVSALHDQFSGPIDAMIDNAKVIGKILLWRRHPRMRRALIREAHERLSH